MKQSLSLFIIMFYVLQLTAQEMMVSCNGAKYSFPIEEVDSVWFSDKTDITDNIGEYSPKLVSSISGNEHYGILLPSGNNLFAFCRNEVHCYEITNSDSLILTKSTTIPLVANRPRSAVDDGEYIYIAYRSTLMGDVESLVPDVRIGYNSHIERFSTSSGESLCNNAILNQFITSIKITSIDLSTVDRAYIFKAYYQNARYRNAILLRQSDGTYLTIFSEYYDSYQDAIDALRKNYKDKSGNEISVNWEVFSKDYNYFSSLVFHTPVLGEFDDYVQEGGASIDELGEGINTNIYSARLKTDADNVQLSKAVLSKDIPSMSTDGYLSFWLKAVTLSDVAYVPLIGNKDNEQLSLKLAPCKRGMTIGFLTNSSEFLSSIVIPTDEWFNYKIHYSYASIELYYRSKECGEWIQLLTTEGLSFVPDRILTGLVSAGAGQHIEIDDLYYHPTEIDKVSYINGQLIVLRKSDLKVVNTFYSDIKFTGTAIHGNTLIVNGLTGYNIYDISEKGSPKLVSWHRTSTYKEYQGLDTFVAQNRVYAFLCNYTSGYSIIDITDPSHSIIVAENKIGTETAPYCHTFNFDVRVKYPYAYTTHATSTAYLDTQDDKRGILVYDLTSLDSIKVNHVTLPKSEFYTFLGTGDQMPNRMSIYKNHYLIVNNSEKGVAIYDISTNPEKPVFKGTIPLGNNAVASEIVSGGGNLFISNMGSGQEKKSIFMYRLTEE